MDDDLTELLDESAQAPAPSDGDLRRISTLAEEQRRAEDEVIAATKVLQLALDNYRRIATVDLPEAMRAANVSDFRTGDGTRIRIEDKLTGTKVTEPEALAYVEANGGSSLIRTGISIEMDRGDVEEARALLRELRAHRLANRFKKLVIEESVHQSTIASFCADLERRGLAPQIERVGVHRIVRAVVGDRAPKQVELKGFADAFR